jgi:hypothetical protein
MVASFMLVRTCHGTPARVRDGRRIADDHTDADVLQLPIATVLSSSITRTQGTLPVQRQDPQMRKLANRDRQRRTAGLRNATVICS